MSQEAALERPATDEVLIPVRMVNEFQYCPRLAYLEWVNSEWAESADTIEGKYRHRRLDSADNVLPSPPEGTGESSQQTCSVTLSSERLGIVAKIDIVETSGQVATPVDYKKGKRPHVAAGAYDPERVQLCAQGMLLEEHGYKSPEGIIYFSESRERVAIKFDEELRGMTLRAIQGLRQATSKQVAPYPLVDSPKCPRCSLVGICLPDEVNHSLGKAASVRPLSVSAEEALPLHIQSFKARVSKKDETLEITVDDGAPQTVRIADISQLVIMGSAYVSAPCLQELMRRDIPISWHSYGGWFYGHSIGTGHKNVELRIAQYRTALDGSRCLEIAREIVAAKIENSRTMERRNWKSDGELETVLLALKELKSQALTAVSLEQLLGIEGAAAARYFGSFPQLLSDHAEVGGFHFESRNRRPPSDPVNALLSFGYAMLAREWTVVLSAVGFDPYLGFYHQPRYGRPALSLDMMELFRPIVADSVVLNVINNGEIAPSDFIMTSDAAALTDKGRKAFVSAFERRMSQEVTHPVFGYKVSYRRLFEVQARLFGRFLIGEVDKVPVFLTR
jgi:CRISPR-associated endonuclease Cas1/CRISPR-associated protein Cas4